jgi:hypothetical protein
MDAVDDILQPAVPPPVAGPVFDGGDFDAFVRTLTAGQTGYLKANATLTRAIRPDDGCASRFTLQSLTASAPVVIGGRVDVRTGCAVTFDTVRLAETGPTGSAGSSWVIASPCQFVQCDLTNNRTKIGLIMNPGSAGYRIDRCRFHDIGEYPPTNGDHGCYSASGQAGVITDSEFSKCADRGIQLRMADGVTVQYVTVQDCGEGIIFGDLTTRNCRASRSVFRNNVVKDRYLIESLGDVAGCAVSDCYAYNDDGRPAVQPGLVGVSVSAIHSSGPVPDGYGPRFPVGC